MSKASRRRGDAQPGIERGDPARRLPQHDAGGEHIEAPGSNTEPELDADGLADHEYVPVLKATPPVESRLTWDVLFQEQIRIAQILREHPPTDEARHDGLVSAPSAITRAALEVFHSIVLHHLLTLDVGSEVARRQRAATLRGQREAADARAQKSKQSEHASGAAVDALADLIVRPNDEYEGEDEQTHDEHTYSVAGDEPIDRTIAETDEGTLARRYPPDPTWRQRTLDELSTKPAPTGPPDDSDVRTLVALRRDLASKQGAHRRRWSLARFGSARSRANYDAIGAGKRPSNTESAIITLRLVTLVNGLRAAGWTMERVADLIIVSVNDWVPPPCSDLVAQWRKGKRGAALAGTSWVEKRWHRGR